MPETKELPKLTMLRFPTPKAPDAEGANGGDAILRGASFHIGEVVRRMEAIAAGGRAETPEEIIERASKELGGSEALLQAARDMNAVAESAQKLSQIYAALALRGLLMEISEAAADD